MGRRFPGWIWIVLCAWIVDLIVGITIMVVREICGTSNAEVQWIDMICNFVRSTVMLIATMWANPISDDDAQGNIVADETEGGQRPHVARDEAAQRNAEGIQQLATRDGQPLPEPEVQDDGVPLGSEQD
jgi:hypothetical protein